MHKISSRCCDYSVSLLNEVPEGYCYVCGVVHKHAHLDLRPISDTLLCKVTARHQVNWSELSLDAKKVRGMENGSFCQSLLTELEALCPHGEPVMFDGHVLRLHMCYGEDCASENTGLDFTTDLCDRNVVQSNEIPGRVQPLVATLDANALQFHVGDILRYDPINSTFEIAKSAAAI